MKIEISGGRVCENVGCGAPAVAVLLIHPRGAASVGGCSAVCAEHLDQAAVKLVRAFRLCNNLADASTSDDLDFLARVQEHLL